MLKGEAEKWMKPIKLEDLRPRGIHYSPESVVENMLQGKVGFVSLEEIATMKKILNIPHIIS